MNKKWNWAIAAGAAIVLSAALATPARAFHQGKHAVKKPSKAVAIGFAQVSPIFNARCIKCHHGPNAPAKMHLDSYAGLMKGNDDGPVVKPGNPKASLLSKMVHGMGKKRMPPPPLPALSKAEIAKIDAWIKAGAKK
jgi:mono/diheme cytochrome c family protein